MPGLTQRHLQASILVVDDLELNRLMITSALETAGFRNIHTAANGKLALEVMERSPIDLVILDLIMPEMDGFEFCKISRSRWPQKHIPILVQTAMADADERLEILSVGASDLLIKPINPKELLLRISLHLKYAFSLTDLAEYRARISAELGTAQRAQHALMPNVHTTRELQDHYGIFLSSYYQPSSEIGGDLWNAIPIDKHRLALYAIDVSGHGMTAAIHAFQLHSMIHHSDMPHKSPSEAMAKLNAYAQRIFNPGEFAVCFYAIIDTNRKTLEYTSAAFTAPLVYQAKSREYQVLNNRGIPLGVTNNATFETHTIPFTTNDSLLFYSDALIESPTLASSQFLTEQEIGSLMQRHLSDGLPDDQQDSLLPALLELLRRDGITDDLMMVLATRSS